MSYSQGGLIAATDYNNFVGTATTSGTINYVWSTGNGQFGYGQTALSQSASTTGLVTATQWATAVNTLNTISTHQSGSGTGIGAPTAGGIVAYLGTLSSSIGTINTNKLNAASTGGTTTGTVYTGSITATNNTTYGEATFAQRTVTFASVDQARYFFNAGGKINLVITGVTNNDGTSRSADAVTLIGTNLGGVSGFGAVSNSGLTGSGGSVNTNNTSVGYYSLTTSAVTYTQVTTTSSTYSGDFVKVYWQTNGTAGSNAANGNVITIYLNYYSAHTSTTSGLYGSSGDTLNVTVSHRVDIVNPETTNLTNTWGTIIVA
jgi:hypothetical protein